MYCTFLKEVNPRTDLAHLAGLQHRESKMEAVSTMVLPTMVAAATTPPVVRPVMTTQLRLAQLAELPSVTKVGTAQLAGLPSVLVKTKVADLCLVPMEAKIAEKLSAPEKAKLVETLPWIMVQARLAVGLPSVPVKAELIVGGQHLWQGSSQPRYFTSIYDGSCWLPLCGLLLIQCSPAEFLWSSLDGVGWCFCEG